MAGQYEETESLYVARPQLIRLDKDRKNAGNSRDCSLHFPYIDAGFIFCLAESARLDLLFIN
jgi:hypothetical protein